MSPDIVALAQRLVTRWSRRCTSYLATELSSHRPTSSSTAREVLYLRPTSTSHYQRDGKRDGNSRDQRVASPLKNKRAWTVHVMLKLHIQYDNYTVIRYCFYSDAVYSFIRFYSGIVSTMYRQYVLQRDSEEARVDAAYPFYRPMPNFQVMSIVHRPSSTAPSHPMRFTTQESSSMPP